MPFPKNATVNSLLFSKIDFWTVGNFLQSCRFPVSWVCTFIYLRIQVSAISKLTYIKSQLLRMMCRKNREIPHSRICLLITKYSLKMYNDKPSSYCNFVSTTLRLRNKLCAFTRTPTIHINSWAKMKFNSCHNVQSLEHCRTMLHIMMKVFKLNHLKLVAFTAATSVLYLG